MFNSRRLQAQTKVCTDTVFKLQYADDAALPSHEPTDLQDKLSTLAGTYHQAGLTVNTKKTEILSSGPDPSSQQRSFTVDGDTLSATQQFTYLAADRDSWRSTCATGLESFAAASEQTASDRRARRQATAQATPVGPACPQCGRVCASDFGLRSHLRVHQRPH